MENTNPEFEEYVAWEDVTHFIEDMIERHAFLSIPIKPLLSSEDQQLNLFDLEPYEPNSKEIKPKIFTMPQSIIDMILLDDLNKDKFKIRIAAFFSHDRPVEENAAFLKEIYYQGNVGFMMEHRQVSVKWDQTGMMIAWGNGIVNSFEQHVLS